MRALIRFDCFGVTFMTMIFTSFVRFLKFNRSVVFSECRSCPRQAASQSHIPFGSLFSFQGTMKRSFTYSHWQRSNAPLNGKIFLNEKTSSLIWTKGAEVHTHFRAFSEKVFEKIYPFTYSHWQRTFGDVNLKKQKQAGTQQQSR